MRPSELLRGLGQPATYYPEMRKITGSLTSTVFFFNFYYWTGSEKSQDGWIYKSAEQIEKETGLTYEEQKTARAKLKKIGLLEEHYRRFEHLMYYRVKLDTFDHLWSEVYGESHIREQGNPSFGEQGNPSFDPIYPLLTTLNNNGSGKKASKKKDDAIDYLAIMALWNDNIEGTPFPLVAHMTDNRKKLIKANIDDVQNWASMLVPVINYISGIEFYTGNNDREWTANFDFLLRKGKLVGLFEKAQAGRLGATKKVPDAIDREIAQMRLELANAGR